MSDDVVIVSARTPVGSFNGVFATTPAHDLRFVVEPAENVMPRGRRPRSRSQAYDFTERRSHRGQRSTKYYIARWSVSDRRNRQI